MTKRKIYLLAPLIMIAAALIYTWTIFLFEPVIPVWKHYPALGLFAVIVFLFIKDFKKCLLATGIYLIVGTFNLLALTPTVTSTSYFIKIASVEISTPSFQLVSFGILVLYFMLNFNALVDTYLDFKEAKNKGKQ